MTNGILLPGIPLSVIVVLLIWDAPKHVRRSLLAIGCVCYAALTIGTLTHVVAYGVTIVQLWTLVPHVPLLWQLDPVAVIGFSLCSLAFIVTVVWPELTREQIIRHALGLLGCTIASGGGTLVGLVIGIGIVCLALWLSRERQRLIHGAILMTATVAALTICAILMLENYGTTEFVSLTAQVGGGLSRMWWVCGGVFALFVPFWCSPKVHDTGLVRWMPLGAAIILLHAFQVGTSTSVLSVFFFILALFGTVVLIVAAGMVYTHRMQRARATQWFYLVIVAPMLIAGATSFTVAALIIAAAGMGTIAYSTMTEPMRMPERRSRKDRFALAVIVLCMAGVPGSAASLGWYAALTTLVGEERIWGIIAVGAALGWGMSCIAGMALAREIAESALVEHALKRGPVSRWTVVLHLFLAGMLCAMGALPLLLVYPIISLIPDPQVLSISSWSTIQLSSGTVIPIDLIVGLAIIGLGCWALGTLGGVELYPDEERNTPPAKSIGWLKSTRRMKHLGRGVLTGFERLEQFFGYMDLWLRDQPRLALILIIAGVFAVLVH